MAAERTVYDMIRAVLFDMGGTLHTASSTPERAVWFARRLIERLGDYGVRLEAEPEEFARRLHENAEDYKHWAEENLRELPSPEVWSRWYLRGYGVEPEQVEPFAEELCFLYEYERACVMRRPHLRQTMDTLRDMGLRLGVISNVLSTSLMPHYLQEYGLDTYMDCVLLSSVAGVRKPSPEIFRMAERAMGMGPEEFAYVGDTLSRDVRGVRNAGWRLAIQIRNPSAAIRDVGLEYLRPDYFIEDLAEIPGIIRSENS